jgi:hypothetical protein
MNLENREALEARCTERMQALAQQGAGVGGVGTRLIIEMLSQLLSPSAEAKAKERWLLWLDEQLDMAEEAVRQRMLSSNLIVAQ